MANFRACAGTDINRIKELMSVGKRRTRCPFLAEDNKGYYCGKFGRALNFVAWSIDYPNGCHLNGKSSP